MLTDTQIQRSSALTVSLCLLAALCEGFDVQAAGVAAAGLSHELHPTPQALGLFFSASGGGLFGGALIGGRASDRLGRKIVLVVSIATFGVFSLLTSVAPDIPSLIGARFLTGLGLGGAMPNLIALAADASALRRRNASIAAAYIGMPLGGVGPSLIALIVPLETWRVVFQVGGIAPLMIVPLLIRYLPGGTPAQRAAAREHSARGGTIQELFCAGRALNTVILWVSFFLIVLTLHLMLNWLPLLLIGRGLGRGHAAIAQALFNVGGAVTGLWLGVLLDSRFRRIAMVSALVLLPVILFAIAASPARPSLLSGLAFLLGGAIMAEQIIVYAVASACYPITVRGTAIGAGVAVGRVGSLVGPLVAASLLAAGRSPAQVLIGVLPIVLLCGICVGFLGWRQLLSHAN